MVEVEYHKVEAYHAGTEVASGPPPINWKAAGEFDPHWLISIGLFVGAMMLLRIVVVILGLYLTCVVGWIGITIMSYGWAGFMFNPFYCVGMSIAAGSVTWLVLIVMSEAFNAPGRIWWKLTR